MARIDLGAITAVFVLLNGCSAPATRAYVAPSPSTVVAERDIVTMGGTRHILSVRNESTVPIVVIAVRLDDCVNIRNACGVVPMSVSVPPGARRRVFELRPARDSARFSYRWTFRWQDRRGEQLADVMAKTARPAVAAFLELRLASDTPAVGYAPMEMPSRQLPVYVATRSIMSDVHVEKLVVEQGSRNGPLLAVTWTAEGATAFATLLRERPGSLLAVLLESRVVALAPIAPPPQRPSATPVEVRRNVTMRIEASEADVLRLQREISRRWPE